LEDLVSPTTAIDLASAHRYFSVKCFNKAWEMIDKPARSEEEQEQMLLLAMASLWHWTQRRDCTDTNRSVGLWQVSRIYSLMGQAENARAFGERSLQAAENEQVPPFYLGYAYEALARAAALSGNQAQVDQYRRRAREIAEGLPDPEAKAQLLQDIGTIP
jgi:hypothetical protein